MVEGPLDAEDFLFGGSEHFAECVRVRHFPYDKYDVQRSAPHKTSQLKVSNISVLAFCRQYLQRVPFAVPDVVIIVAVEQAHVIHPLSDALPIVHVLQDGATVVVQHHRAHQLRERDDRHLQLHGHRLQLFEDGGEFGSTVCVWYWGNHQLQVVDDDPADVVRFPQLAHFLPDRIHRQYCRVVNMNPFWALAGGVAQKELFAFHFEREIRGG